MWPKKVVTAETPPAVLAQRPRACADRAIRSARSPGGGAAARRRPIAVGLRWPSPTSPGSSTNTGLEHRVASPPRRAWACPADPIDSASPLSLSVGVVLAARCAANPCTPIFPCPTRRRATLYGHSQVRTGLQRRDRQDTGPHDAAGAACHRQRGHRMGNCHLVAGRSLIDLVASRLALCAPALRAATTLTRPNRSAQRLPCGRHSVPTAKTVGPNNVVTNHCVERGDHLTHHRHDDDLRLLS